MLRSYFGFIIFIGLLSGENVFAQTDYLVTAKGDTLKGQIGFQMLGKVEQAIIKANKRKTISAIQTREVFLKNTRYKPVQFDGLVRFMKVLSEGYVSKLAFQLEGAHSYDGILLKKRDGEMLEVPSLGFKKLMSNFFDDYELLSKQIEDGELGRGDLDKIITNYNQFISGRTTTVQVQNQPQPEISQNQKTNLELLYELKSDVEKADFQAKQDVLGMIADVEGKIKDNKTLPNYLIQSLKTSLTDQPALLEKFEKFLGSLN